jgi:hypothetical protein
MLIVSWIADEVTEELHLEQSWMAEDALQQLLDARQSIYSSNNTGAVHALV